MASSRGSSGATNVRRRHSFGDRTRASALIDQRLANDALLEVQLRDGQWIRVFNIARGYDEGADLAHLTTNISPSVEGESVDFFFSDAGRASCRPGKWISVVRRPAAIRPS